MKLDSVRDVEREFWAPVMCNEMTLQNVVRFADDSFRVSIHQTVVYACFILQRKRLGVPLTIDVKKQLAKSLFELHSRDITHGDPRIDDAIIVDHQSNG